MSVRDKSGLNRLCCRAVFLPFCYVAQMSVCERVSSSPYGRKARPWGVSCKWSFSGSEQIRRGAASEAVQRDHYIGFRNTEKWRTFLRVCFSKAEYWADSRLPLRFSRLWCGQKEVLLQLVTVRNSKRLTHILLTVCEPLIRTCFILYIF